MSRRTEMLGSTIQKELALVIMRELNDPRLVGMPSITRVKVSPDLSIADVYVTIMGTEGQQSAALNALKHSAGMMRTKLTKVLSLRQAPYLKFHIDEQLKKEIAVLDLLRKVREEDAERTAAAGDDDGVGADDAAGDDAAGEAAKQQLEPQPDGAAAAAADEAPDDERDNREAKAE